MFIFCGFVYNCRIVFAELFINYGIIIYPVLAFILIFLSLSIKFKKGIDVFSLCDFEGAKKKNRTRIYKTYTCYNFSINDINKIFNKAFRYYRSLIIKGEYLFSFEKELLKNSHNLKEEYKQLSAKLGVYSGAEFFENVPLSIIETIENINCGFTTEDKNSLDYKIAKLTVLASYYYSSLLFSDKLKIGSLSGYRKNRTDKKFIEIEKTLLKKFYGLMDIKPDFKEENLFYKIRGEQRINHLFAGSADLLADEFGNFAYAKDGKCVSEFGKFNFLKHFNFKSKNVFFTDKFCVYENELGSAVKICLDINGNIILITNFTGLNKIFLIKISSYNLKFFEKTSFLHSTLLFEKCGEIVPYRLTGLVYNNAVFDAGVRGSCVNRASKGALKGFKYEQLFKNVKLAAIFMQNEDNFEAQKILKFIKTFNKFNYEFYIVAVADFFIESADECFKLNELDDEKISFLKKYSAVFFDGKKIKVRLNFINKIKENNFFKTEPFFKIKNTRLKELAEILYSVPAKEDDTAFNYCLKNILDMSKENRVNHFQNILNLFKTQTLEGLMPDSFKEGFYDFKSSTGLLSVFYYLICFINKYSESDILKETVKYGTFSAKGFTLEESKIYDTLEYHLLAGLRYLLNSEENLKTEIFKLFILKKITSLFFDAKIKKNIFNYINVLNKKLREKLAGTDEKFLERIFDYINLTVKKTGQENGLIKIMNLFENNSFKDFETSVLELASVDCEDEKFLSMFLLKQFLTENILGIKFHKNLISFNPSLPKEIPNLKIEIDKAIFTIGYFGYCGIEIKGRKYYNYNYINLDQESETIISIG